MGLLVYEYHLSCHNNNYRRKRFIKHKKSETCHLALKTYWVSFKTKPAFYQQLFEVDSYSACPYTYAPLFAIKV